MHGILIARAISQCPPWQAFNGVLDAIQNRQHGDVQVCLMGLSLVPEDIEWFEDEECDDTHIRTIEAFEVEQQQMLRREVITKEATARKVRVRRPGKAASSPSYASCESAAR